MGKYGQAAVEAAMMLRTGDVRDPRRAWELVTTRIFGAGKSQQVKSCPRGAFLGLASAGLLEGVPGSAHSQIGDNGRYAVEAVGVLRQRPELASNQAALWRAVMGEEDKAPNNQMEVVLALWHGGQIGRH